MTAKMNSSQFCDAEEIPKFSTLFNFLFKMQLNGIWGVLVQRPVNHFNFRSIPANYDSDQDFASKFLVRDSVKHHRFNFFYYFILNYHISRKNCQNPLIYLYIIIMLYYIYINNYYNVVYFNNIIIPYKECFFFFFVIL